MDYSKNYNFNLPSCKADDIADIDLISDNFRTIDSVMNRTDATFNPDSDNAQSGKAVAEAVKTVQIIEDGTEFVFDGGGAAQDFTADIVIDTTMSKTSSDAIANKAVAFKFEEVALNFAELENKISEVRSKIYPIGSIYISFIDADPTALFGGTWERIKDRFILAAGDNYVIGDTGGEVSHILTTEEMPKHNHVLNSSYGRNADTVGVLTLGATEISGAAPATVGQITYSGSGQSHNNMPPYLAVYMWKRTA